MPLGHQIRTIAIAAAAATTLAGGVAAQDTQMPASPPPLEGPVSDQMIDVFAATAIEVQVVANDYAAQIEAAESEADRQQLVETANADIAGTIEAAEGITIEEYLQIAEAASEDPALNQRILTRVEAELAE